MLENVLSIAICLVSNSFSADICFKCRYLYFEYRFRSLHTGIFIAATDISVLNRYVFLNTRDICILTDFYNKIQMQIFILNFKISVLYDKQRCIYFKYRYFSF